MARRVLIPDAAIRKDDSIASPILRLLAHASLELRLNARTVFRVNPVKPEWRSRDVLTRLNGIRTLNLRRALDKRPLPDRTASLQYRLSRCTSSRKVSLRRNASSAVFLSWMSVPTVYHREVPS